MRMKKKALTEAINKQSTHVGKLTRRKVAEMALEYVTLVDANSNGMIERSEFHEFFSTFDGICLADAEIDDMFDIADQDKGGHLSVEEFAGCLFQIIVPEGFDDSDDESFKDVYARITKERQGGDL